MNDPIIVGAFYVLAFLVVASALAVTLARNVVHAALLLVVTFFSVAGIYVLLSADFVAVVQVLIYVGAVMILLLFAIMLTQRTSMAQTNPSNAQYAWGAAVAVVLLALMLAGFTGNRWPALPGPLPSSTVQYIGEAFFSRYAVAFEIAAVLLLAALVGAIVLAADDKERKP